MIERSCQVCAVAFIKPPSVSYAAFANRKCCSRTCGAKASADVRTIARPAGWKRDRTREKKWADWSQNHYARLGSLVSKARQRAKERGLPFCITSADARALWERQQGKCALTGRAFDLSPSEGRFLINPNAPSIDRIQPALGYIIGNVRLITAHMNNALASYGDEEFRKLALDFLGFGRENEW